jgi:hypothetical protein
MKKWACELNMEFSKEEVQMASKYMKKYSTSLALKEIQIKTALRFHLTPVQMAIIKGNNNKCWQGCGKTGTLIHYWWECKLGQPIWKALFKMTKLWKQTRCPGTEEWIMKLWYIFTMEYYSATGNNEMGFEGK